MTRANLRALIAEAVISVGLVAAVRFFAADPLEHAAAQARADSERRYLRSLSIDLARARHFALDAASRAAAVQQASSHAADELTALARLSRIVQDSGATLEHLEQRETPSPQPVAPPTGAPAPAVATPADRRIGFALAVRATYAQAAALLHLIQHEAGFTAVDRARILPAGDTDHPLVSIAVDTSTWWIDADPVRAEAESLAQTIASFMESSP